MLIVENQKKMPLKMMDNGKVLELMCDEDVDVNSFFEGIQELETIEEEPDMACLWTCTMACKNNYKHSVLCGNPSSYLYCKAKRDESYEAVIVHADRMYCSQEIWNQIEALRPTWILMVYKSWKKGELHRKMMRSHGFEVVLQNEDTTRKLCLGRSKNK